VAISSDASRSCLRADQVLIESVHSMAREDRDGSAIGIDDMAISPLIVRKRY